MRNALHDLPLVGAGQVQAAGRRALTAEIRRAYLAGEHRDAVTPARMTVKESAPVKVFGAMPSVSAAQGLFVTKVATRVERPGPARPGPAAPAIQALVIAMSATTGEPLAVLDGAALTGLKCAAVTALFTDACAAPDAATAGLVGTGALAYQQVLGLTDVRQLRCLTVYGRNRDRAAAFARRVSRAFPDGPRVRLADEAAGAFDGTDIVCTATTSDQPLVTGITPAPGTHVNCMGSHTPHSREVDRAFLDGCVLLVEDREVAIAEAGSLHERALDLGEMLRADPASLRRAATFFSSTGHAFLDLVTTAHVLRSLGLHSPPGPHGSPGPHGPAPDAAGDG